MTNIAKKMAQDRKNILRREDYRKVKKMDRTQFEAFCKNLYIEGYQDGRESVPGIDISQVREAIAETKGIGVNRLEAIMHSIEQRFKGDKGDTGISGPSSETYFEIRNGKWDEKYAELQTLCFTIQKFLLKNPEIAAKVEITTSNMKSFLEAE